MRSFSILLVVTLFSLNSVAQIGGVGINAPVPRAMLHVGDSSVLFTAPPTLSGSPGPTPVTGAGNRMMWYADKAAFRVGGVAGINWDRDSIGQFSFATGSNTKAIGIRSFASGDNTTASGNGAFASGAFTRASGTHASSFGFGSQATANSALASGLNSIASANAATAFGSGCLALGFASLASGSSTTASASEAVALNTATTANGFSSSALGYNSIANGTACLSVGAFNDPIVSPIMAYVLSPETPMFIVGNGISESARQNAMVVRLDGKTGIGTSSPESRLHVHVPLPNQILAKFSSNNGYGEVNVSNGLSTVEFGVTIAGGYLGTKDQGDLFIKTGGLVRAIVKDSTGNVGIGTFNPTAKLEVNGTAMKPGGGSWTATSDIRLKQNINPYEVGLDAVLAIRPVSYQYNTLSGMNTDETHVGVIAQELQNVAPYMVSVSQKIYENGSTGYLQVDNSAMTYMLINAVKELSAKVEALQQQLNDENR